MSKRRLIYVVNVSNTSFERYDCFKDVNIWEIMSCVYWQYWVYDFKSHLLSPRYAFNFEIKLVNWCDIVMHYYVFYINKFGDEKSGKRCEKSGNFENVLFFPVSAPDFFYIYKSSFSFYNDPFF